MKRARGAKRGSMDSRRIALGCETGNHESNWIAPHKQWLFM
jgi:hypothetical protein